MIGNKSVDLIGDVLETVHHLFEMIIEFSLDNEIHGGLRTVLKACLIERLAALVVELVGALLADFDVTPEQARLDVLAFLRQLRERGFVQP